MQTGSPAQAFSQQEKIVPPQHEGHQSCCRMIGQEGLREPGLCRQIGKMQRRKEFKKTTPIVRCGGGKKAAGGLSGTAPHRIHAFR